jgi:hypothetical protein
VLLLLRWPAQPAAVAAGVLVMAWGDGFAGLIGPIWPSPSWQVWGQKRSLLGTGAMSLASLGALVLVRQLALAAGLTAPDLGALAAMALLATSLEQVAWLGMDNLSVPLAVAALWLVVWGLSWAFESSVQGLLTAMDPGLLTAKPGHQQAIGGFVPQAQLPLENHLRPLHGDFQEDVTH